MNRILNVFQITLLALVALCLISFLIYAVVSGGNFNIFDSHNIEKTADNVRREKTYDLSNIQDLNLNFVSSDMELIVTDDKDMRVVQYAKSDLEKDDLFTSEETGKTLEINDRTNKFTFFNFGFHHSAFTIYIPKSYINNLDIHAASSDLLIDEELQFNNLELNFVSGDIKINNNVTSNDLKLKTVSGDIDVASIVGKTASIETTSGNISINNVTLDSNIKTVSGDIEIDNLTGGANLQTISGNIGVGSYNIMSNSKAKTVSGNVRISLDKNANCELRVDTISGNVDLPNGSHVVGNPPYNILDIETISGNVGIDLK